MTPDAELQIFAIKRGMIEKRMDVSFFQTEKSQHSFNKTPVIFTQGHSVSFPLMLFSDYSWLS